MYLLIILEIQKSLRVVMKLVLPFGKLILVGVPRKGK